MFLKLKDKNYICNTTSINPNISVSLNALQIFIFYMKNKAWDQAYFVPACYEGLPADSAIPGQIREKSLITT